MLRNVKVYKGGEAHLGRRVAQSGYIGDVPIMENAVTITLMKPGADLESVKRSLEITIQDIELRIEQGVKK